MDADDLKTLESLSDPTLKRRLKSIFKEFINAAQMFDEQKINKTIVFYGSHCLTSWEHAQNEMREVELLFDKSKRRTQRQWDELDKASNAVYMSRYYDAAEELSFKISEWSEKKFKKQDDKHVICSGGGPGIMEASNKGAHRANAPSIGLAINITEEQEKNHFITPELKFLFHYFFIRKFWFLYHVSAIVVFPGGFGTLDELFDILNLIKTKKKSRSIPVVLFGTDFWKSILDFDPMIQHGTIQAKDLEMVHYSDSTKDAFKYITESIMSE